MTHQALSQALTAHRAPPKSLAASFADKRPEPLLLTALQSASLLGMSERRFHQLRPQLPAPVVLGVRHVRWKRSSLVAWVNSLESEGAQRPEPTQLRGSDKRRKKIGSGGYLGETGSPSTESRADVGSQQSKSPSNSSQAQVLA
jgi:predicted DNA-binding transcriptional regulator AlpA